MQAEALDLDTVHGAVTHLDTWTKRSVTNDEKLPSLGGKSFADMKMTNEHGADYWSARDIQPLLSYDQWRRFENAIQKARTSCEQSGNDCDQHFAGAGKMIEIGKGGVREVPGWHLSRFACYLIAQNGDPRKPEIALAQRYSAVQARRQELADLGVRTDEVCKRALVAKMFRLESCKAATLSYGTSRRRHARWLSYV